MKESFDKLMSTYVNSSPPSMRVSLDNSTVPKVKIDGDVPVVNGSTNFQAGVRNITGTTLDVNVGNDVSATVSFTLLTEAFLGGLFSTQTVAIDAAVAANATTVVAGIAAAEVLTAAAIVTATNALNSTNPGALGGRLIAINNTLGLLRTDITGAVGDTVVNWLKTLDFNLNALKTITSASDSRLVDVVTNTSNIVDAINGTMSAVGLKGKVDISNTYLSSINTNTSSIVSSTSGIPTIITNTANINNSVNTKGDSIVLAVTNGMNNLHADNVSYRSYHEDQRIVGPLMYRSGSSWAIKPGATAQDHHDLPNAWIPSMLGALSGPLTINDGSFVIRTVPHSTGVSGTVCLNTRGAL